MSSFKVGVSQIYEDHFELIIEADSIQDAMDKATIYTDSYNLVDGDVSESGDIEVNQVRSSLDGIHEIKYVNKN